MTQENSSPIRPRRLSRSRMVIFILMGLAAIALFWLVYRRMNDSLAPVEIEISRETTAVTEPVLEDGTVSYFAYLQGKLSAGVTEENNAMRRVLEITGGEMIPQAVRLEVLKKLSLPESLAEEDRYMDLVDFADGLDPEQLPASLQISPAKRERILELKSQIRQEIDQYGSPNPQIVQDYLEARKGSVTQLVMDRLETAGRGQWSGREYPYLAQWLDQIMPVLVDIANGTRLPRFYLPLVSYEALDPPNLLLALQLPKEPFKELGLSMLAMAMKDVESEEMDQSFEWVLAAHRLARLLRQGWSYGSLEASVYLEHTAARTALQLMSSPEAKPSFLKEAQQRLAQIAPANDLVESFNEAGRFTALSFSNLAYRGQSATGKPLPAEQLRRHREAYDWNLARRLFNDWFDRLVAVAAIEDYPKRKEESAAFEEQMHQWLEQAREKYRQRQGLWGRLNSLMEDAQQRREFLSRHMAAVMMGGAQTVLEMRWALINTLDEALCRRRMAILVAALRRRKAVVGEYPQHLESLADRWISEIPADPFSAEGFIYRKIDEGFLLYSIGRNLEDNGGDEGEDIAVRFPPEDE